MKVCIVLPQGRVSGAERVLLELVQAHPPAELLALCPTDSDISRLLIAEGVPTRHCEIPKRAETASAASFAAALVSAARNVMRATSDWKPDVLHVFLPLALKAALPAAVLGRCPTVLSVHDVLTSRSIGRLNARVNRAAARAVKSIVAVSDFVRETLVETGYDPARIITVHNGINTVRFANPAVPGDEMRRRYNFQEDEFVFGVFGRLTAWKGQVLALEALQRVLSQGVRAQLLVLGSPFYPSDETYAASLPALAATLGVADRVRFISAQEDVASHYAAVDAMLVPSLEPDPFPTVVLETGAAGRPVIATTLGGAKEAILNGETGIVTTPNQEDFAQAMHHLATSGVASKMGQLAHEHVGRHFSNNTYAARMAGVWAAAATPAGERP